MTGMNTPARNTGLGLPAIDAAIRAIRQEYPSLQRTGFTSLLPNGTFDNATGLTLGTGWSVGSGVASHAAGTQSNMTQEITNRAAGRRYALGFDYNHTSGASTVVFYDSQNLGNFSTTGPKSVAFHDIGVNRTVAFQAQSNGVVSIDNAHVWEADPADDLPWLRLPEGFRVKVGKNGDLHRLAKVVRDGLELFDVDFEEKRSGNQWFIKPNAAPGVSTRFSVVSYKAI